ncbi:MAG: restriction endonuclease subunit S [Pseudomonadota bacterium]
MKVDWQSRSFEECIDPVSYAAKLQRKDFLSEGAYPVVSQEEAFINGFWDQEGDLFRVERPVVVFGDHTRALKYIDFDFVLGADGVKVLKPKQFLHPRFFYYQLHTARLDSLGYARHYRLLREHLVAYPGYEEQQRIVAILDEAFDGIATAKANAEKNLQNARALFESHLDSVFAQRDDGWALTNLGDLATFRNGINFTKSSRGDTVKIVGVRDFQKDFWAPLDSLDTVTTDGVLPESDMLKEHDLLFVRSNGNKELIGRCLLVGPVNTRITHSGFTIRARLNGDAVKPEYLCHFLKSNKAKREMIDSGAGANISSLNQTTLAGLLIPFPSVAAQDLIVQKIQTVAAETQRLESIYQQKLAAVDELKKSLLHQAFSGRL